MWQAWHEGYQDPASDLSQRLAIVQTRIRMWADAAPSGPLRLISMCAGQAQDVVGSLGAHPRRDDIEGVLVELDEYNVAVARRGLDAAGLSGIASVVGDAGDAAQYADAVPAALLLVCGVFGNISDEDVHNTVSALPMLVASGATVIWTRHRREPDFTHQIRRWFSEYRFDEVFFDSPGPGRFAVGVHRFAGTPQALITEHRPLFAFKK